MTDTVSSSRRTPPEPPTAIDAPGCLVRLLWIALGPILLLFLATRIYTSRSFSLLDLAYWATVAAILGARHLDIHRFHGATTSGEPATPEHLRRYTYGVAGVALVIWMLVNMPTLLRSGQP